MVSRSRQVNMKRVSKPAWCSHSQPEEVAVDAFHLREKDPDCVRAGGRRDPRKLFHSEGVRRGVDVRADPADALHEVEVVDPAAVSAAFSIPLCT